MSVSWEGDAREGSAVSAGAVVAGHSGAARAVAPVITLHQAQAPGATPRGCCVTGQDLGLSSPQGCGINRHFLLGFAVFPGNCSVPALLLSKGNGHSCAWDGAVPVFCVGAVISASPQDRISALSSENKTLGRGGAGRALCQGSPGALCFHVLQIQCWCCPPAMEPW